MKIFVAKLNFKTTEAKLRSLFDQYGDVNSVRIPTDRESGRSKGYGFVEMSDSAGAKSAIAGLNGAEVDGRAIVVQESNR